MFKKLGLTSNKDFTDKSYEEKLEILNDSKAIEKHIDSILSCCLNPENDDFLLTMNWPSSDVLTKLASAAMNHDRDDIDDKFALALIHSANYYQDQEKLDRAHDIITNHLNPPYSKQDVQFGAWTAHSGYRSWIAKKFVDEDPDFIKKIIQFRRLVQFKDKALEDIMIKAAINTEIDLRRLTPTLKQAVSDDSFQIVLENILSTFINTNSNSDPLPIIKHTDDPMEVFDDFVDQYDLDFDQVRSDYVSDPANFNIIQSPELWKRYIKIGSPKQCQLLLYEAVNSQSTALIKALFEYGIGGDYDVDWFKLLNTAHMNDDEQTARLVLNEVASRDGVNIQQQYMQQCDNNERGKIYSNFSPAYTYNLVQGTEYLEYYALFLAREAKPNKIHQFEQEVGIDTILEHIGAEDQNTIKNKLLHSGKYTDDEVQAIVAAASI